MSRPRVFYILGSLAANDMGDEIVGVLGRLSRSEFEPRVVALGGREDLRDRLLEMKVRVYTLGAAGAFGTWRAVSKVRKLINSLGADVVHGFGSWGGSVAQLATPQAVPVVRSITRPPNHESDLQGRVLQFMERRGRRRVQTRFVVPNEGSRGLAVRAYAAVEGHVTVLPTSIDVAAVRGRFQHMSREEARVLMGIRPNETAVVLISDFDSGARMDQILTGVAIAVREQEGLRVFVIGSGRYESSTRWMAEELQLGDSVVFLGRGTEAGPIWAAADVGVDATPWASWSRVALLSIAAGVPTLKRQEGVSGWSEELGESLPMISGHPERFASELVRLVTDGPLREEIRHQGSVLAQEVDVTNVVEQLGKLYRSLMD